MTMVSKGSALMLGVVLYVAEEFFIGYLTATTVPKAYFAFFGTHKVVALVLEEAVVVAFPVFLLALGWGLATTKLVRLPPYRVTGWAVAGLMLAWFGRVLQGVIDLQSGPSPSQYSFATLLLALLVPPVWGVLSSAAAPLGVLGAGLIAHRRDAPR